jgi:hypothetical protein
MLKVEYKKYKIAMDMMLWKMKSALKATAGPVFKDFVVSSLSAKQQKAEDERVALAISTATAAAAAAIVLPAPRGGLFGYFAPV